MRSQKSILIKKTMIPINIGNQSTSYQGSNNLRTLYPLSIEGSTMRASGSAPNLQQCVRNSISPEDYQSLKRIPCEMRTEAGNGLFLKNGGSGNQSKLKLQPLTTINAQTSKQQYFPGLQLPVSMSNKNQRDILSQIDLSQKQYNKQINTKKLKPLLNYDYNKNNLLPIQISEEKEDKEESQKKVKKTRKKKQNRESQNMMKKIYTTKEALKELIKIIMELEIIVEGDIYSLDLQRIITKLLKSKEEVKREIILCNKEESYDLIYDHIYISVLEAICHKEFSEEYQYICKKFSEVLNQTPHVPKDEVEVIDGQNKNN